MHKAQSCAVVTVFCTESPLRELCRVEAVNLQHRIEESPDAHRHNECLLPFAACQATRTPACWCRACTTSHTNTKDSKHRSPSGMLLRWHIYPWVCICVNHSNCNEAQAHLQRVIAARCQRGHESHLTGSLQARAAAMMICATFSMVSAVLS
jgi:hypothetical protein